VGGGVDKSMGTLYVLKGKIKHAKGKGKKKKGT